MAILIIESFLHNKLIGFNYKSNIWLRLTQNAIEHSPNYWEEILLEVKYSGKYDYLLKRDKKGKLKRKIDDFNEDFIQLFIHLYPELVYST